MRILFVSGEMIGADLCYKLKKEGCDVRLYIEDESRRDCFEGMVDKTSDWKGELKWVGKNGLIVFDDVGYGGVQDELRAQGFNVVGGSELGDRLEQDREFGQKIFSEAGLSVVPSKNFYHIDEAIRFVKENPGKWVVKQDGHLGMLNYVGVLDDGRDVIGILENYKRYFDKIGSVNLQKRVDGIEIGVARYFNGNSWVGPVEFNVEHKDLCNGNIGPKTGEMGTVMWFEDDENIKLYKETLAKLEPFLKKAKFKGDIDINFIVNEEGAFPLEATTRFGCPATQLQIELFDSPWNEFLLSIAKGKSYNLKYKKGYGLIVSIAIPPFPYKSIENDYYQSGVPITFSSELTRQELERLHFEEVILDEKGVYRISGSNGYIVYVSGFGETISIARNEAYDLVNKLVIPKMFYRTDIGVLLESSQMGILRKMGWIK